MKFKCLNVFLSTKMEENTFLGSHLRKMYDHHKYLTVDWDYWMADAFAIDVVLRSLPPSYGGVVSGYVVRGESFTFAEFMSQIRTIQVQPIAGEIIDGEGIFDIHVTKVFQTLIVVLSI